MLLGCTSSLSSIAYTSADPSLTAGVSMTAGPTSLYLVLMHQKVVDGSVLGYQVVASHCKAVATNSTGFSSIFSGECVSSASFSAVDVSNCVVAVC